MPIRSNPRATWAVLALIVLPTLRVCAASPEVTLTVRADQPGPRISPTQWGIFFEDINFAADGGLYAELVKNRSFEFPNPLLGWRPIPEDDAGSLAIHDRDPAQAANPHYLRLAVDGVEGGFGVSNEGFRGMGVREGEAYLFSASMRLAAGGPLRLRLELVARDGSSLARAELDGFDRKWATRTCTLRPNATAARARLDLVVEGRGALDLDTVSLFPERTWKGRRGGLRADLVQMLADLRPGFIRFPGGCIVEGERLETRYQWKETIGKPEERRPLINRWNNQRRHRPTMDYYQSFGLGFFEFFQLCEDVGAEPLPVLNCGMACQFNSGELASLDEHEPSGCRDYVQDALDLIEFANGPESSPWGRRRAEMGHPQPFGMKMLGVGNEQWGPDYIARYELFARAIKAKHPEIRLVAAAGPGPGGDRFEYSWKELRKLGADIMDEHVYAPEDWFYGAVSRYATYDRKGPKVFMGEYAAQTKGVGSSDNRNTLGCALAEAAFMTGLERNADVVVMASYAPLMAHRDAWQWAPDLIWFDNLRVYATPSYYVQQLFGRNRGDVVLPVELGDPKRSSDRRPRLYTTASRDESSGEIILKLVNAEAEPVEVLLQVKGSGEVASAAKSTVLTGPGKESENSFREPHKVAPVSETIHGASAEFAHAFPARSVTVLRLAVKR